MTRNLKALGLVALAAVAASAVVASTASATKFTAATYPVHVTGKDVGPANDKFTGGGQVVECDVDTFTSALVQKATELTVAPTYDKCKKAGGGPATITPNGCHYEFEVESGMENEWDGNMSLRCPAGSLFEIHTYANDADHVAKKSNCTLAFGTQFFRKAVKYTNETATGSIILEGTIKEIKGEIHGACSFGFTLKIDGEYHLGATVEGDLGKTVIDVGA
jgi:hypothetical protein